MNRERDIYMWMDSDRKREKSRKSQREGKRDRYKERKGEKGRDMERDIQLESYHFSKIPSPNLLKP